MTDDDDPTLQEKLDAALDQYVGGGWWREHPDADKIRATWESSLRRLLNSLVPVARALERQERR